MLKPVFSCPDPIRGGDDILVLCEVLLTDMSPHPTNTRAATAALHEKYKAQEPLFGLEQEYSLFLAQSALDRLLAGAYKQPERTVVESEILHSIIGHRRRGEPYTVEAGVVRVADALDMAQGRTRIPIEAGHEGIHSISAAAIDEVRISAGEDHPVRIEIQLNNSAGIFQVDDLLATKIRGTPLEGKVEVVAEIEGETEKRLLSGFRLA